MDHHGLEMQRYQLEVIAVYVIFVEGLACHMLSCINSCNNLHMTVGKPRHGEISKQWSHVLNPGPLSLIPAV